VAAAARIGTGWSRVNGSLFDGRIFRPWQGDGAQFSESSSGNWLGSQESANAILALRYRRLNMLNLLVNLPRRMASPCQIVFYRSFGQLESPKKIRKMKKLFGKLLFKKIVIESNLR
jgi:hypothetical protein